jgi:hypothetical protein
MVEQIDVLGALGFLSSEIEFECLKSPIELLIVVFFPLKFLVGFLDGRE